MASRAAGPAALVTLAACTLPTEPMAPTAPTAPTAPPSTQGVLCTLSGNVHNPDPSVQRTAHYRWTCSEGVRQLVANGVPDHAVGRFPGPGNPHPIGAVDTRAAYPLQPVPGTRPTPVVTAGYALNGVKLEPATAGTCDDSGRDCRMARSSLPWHLEALGQSAFNFGTDDSNGHVQPSGAYHYHGVPERLLAARSTGPTAMTLVAWAPDGHPIYARYGHQSAHDASSPTVAMRPSYRLKATPDPGRPAVAQFAMGTFTQDYAYQPGSGDLDACNGRTGVTPEFPQGTYHYLITDAFPFIGRCVQGVAASRR